MNGEPLESSYEFGPFRLEPATRRLLREGEPLPLTPKAFDTLLLLVQNRGRVVEKEEVLRRVWPDAVVEESNLAQNVFTLRKALGDTPEGARFIATVPRRGYRFVAPVTPPSVAEPSRPVPVTDVRPPAFPGRSRLARAIGLGLVLLLLPLGGYLAGRRTRVAAPLELQRLTFRRGIVGGARFAPDGRTVIYSASWDGSPRQVFMSRPGSPESMVLALPSAEVLAVSPAGEVALGLRPSLLNRQMGNFGTLARAALTGGVPREVLENVEAADWSPDGKSLAVVRKVENRLKRLEYPIGRVLVETTASQCLHEPSVARDGAHVAFVECEKPDHYGSVTVSVSVVDGAGARRRLWSGTEWVSGLAWSPDGDEVWFTTGSRLHLPQTRAVSLSGRTRTLRALPGAIADVSREGGVLVVTGQGRSGIRGRGPEDAEERELSWLEGSAATDVSADGRLVLFGEMMEGGGVSGRIYLRATDGAPAVHLGDGFPLGLSPDAATAAVRLHGREGLTFLPTGPGEPRTVPTRSVDVYLARWFADGRRLLVGAMAPGREGRLYVLDSGSGPLRPITPEMTGVGVVSPDGRWVATIGHDGHFLYPVGGGERRPLPGLDLDEWPLQWRSDGAAVYVWRQGDLPAAVTLVDVATGARTPWRSLMPADAAGIVWMEPLVSADGRAYVYTYRRLLTDLYLASGLE